jgi:hypothetical protein
MALASNNQQKDSQMNQAVTNTNLPPKGKLVVIACGGTGINIAEGVGGIQIDRSILADVDVVLVDTSKSNLLNHKGNYDCHLIRDLQGEDLDGSGKFRGENIDAITDQIKPLLQTYGEYDLVVTVGGAAGGSGGPINNAIVSECLARGLPVIPLVVGSIASYIEARNTLMTLKSFEAAAQKRNVPVSMSYLQNSFDMPQKRVNELMVSFISYLAILFSRRNHGLDTKDLEFLLRFNRQPISSYPAILTMLTVLWHNEGDPKLKEDLAALGNIITVATLAQKDVNTDLPVIPEYQTVGRLPAAFESSGNTDGKMVNYIVSDGPVHPIIKDLERLVAEKEKNADSRTTRPAVIKEGDKPTKGDVFI